MQMQSDTNLIIYGQYFSVEEQNWSFPNGMQVLSGNENKYDWGSGELADAGCYGNIAYFKYSGPNSL